MHSTPRLLGVLLSALVVSLHAAAASAPVSAGSTDAFRLTREVEPLAQSVELTLDPAKDDYTGRVIIDLLAHEPFTSLRLH
ncbi:MAG: hypothetical protein WCR49_10350, partial [Opitutae bacterium]